MPRYTIAINRPTDLFGGLAPGDLVCVEPGAPQPIVVLRALATNYGMTLGLLEDGVGVLITENLSVADLAAVVGQSALPAGLSGVPGDGGARRQASGAPGRPTLRLHRPGES